MGREYFKTGVKAPDGYEETVSIYVCDGCGLREAEYGLYCESCAEKRREELAYLQDDDDVPQTYAGDETLP